MRTSTSSAPPARPGARAPQTPAALRALAAREATRLGFSAFAVADPDGIPLAAPRLAAFVAADRHGTMSWMRETLARRGHPRALWPDVRAVLVLAATYAPARDPRPELAERSTGYVSVYARHRDYHEVLKGRLKELAAKLAARSNADVKVFVDTAPVMEKPLAASAGLGWQGKHTNLVSRTHGSWLFLGTVFTAAELPFDNPEPDRCGSCRACLDACPTNAFPAPYQIDARRCLSYLTIESKGPIPREFRAALGNRVYGCDDCLAACPWNKFARDAADAKFAARADLVEPPLADFLALDDAAFRARFAGSPVKRIGRDRFLRNAAVAAGNSADPALVAPLQRLLADPSPLVRGASVWALSRLLPPDAFAALSRATPPDSDPQVQAEWIALAVERTSPHRGEGDGSRTRGPVVAIPTPRP